MYLYNPLPCQCTGTEREMEGRKERKKERKKEIKERKKDMLITTTLVSKHVLSPTFEK